MVETSIIIRAFNEEKHLPALFDAIGRQNYRDFETVLVDSGSYDRTRDIAEEHGARILRISSHDFTFGYSLNVGIEAAVGRKIVIVSAHTIPTDENWLENLLAPLNDESVAMAYGRQVGVRESKFSEAEDFERLFGIQNREDSTGKIRANNANSAIRRDLWEKKNFNSEITGLEDADWASHWLGRKMRVVYVPTAVIRHIHEETWPQVERRYFREAVAARRMGLVGRRHIPREISREVRRLFLDWARCFGPSDNPVSGRLMLPARLWDVAMFRLRKSGGIIKGLLTQNPLVTREAQEEIFFSRRNKAVVIHAVGRARMDTRELPTLRPGDALIRVENVAICATDLEILDGKLGYYKDGTASYPIVPGHEFSGRIAALGTNANGFSEGDPVVVECIQSCGICDACRADNPIGCPERAELGVMRRDGAYAEYVTAPARFIHRLPPDLPTDKGSLAEPVAVILKGLGRLENQLALKAAPWKCAVLGAGPLGHICARILLYKGHRVTVFDKNASRLALFDGTEIQTSPTIDGLDKYDVLIEITGNPDVLDAALRKSAANASLLLLGLPYGERQFSFEAIAAYDKTVIGSVGSTAADFEAAIKLLPELDLEEHLRCKLPLAEFDDGWQKARSGEVLKVILHVA